MEVFLQWLDELDDLVFAGFALWHRLRRLCLGVAFVTAIAVHALPRLGIDSDAILTLFDISLAALAVWLLFATMSAAVARSRHSLAAMA